MSIRFVNVIRVINENYIHFIQYSPVYEHNILNNNSQHQKAQLLT